MFSIGEGVRITRKLRGLDHQPALRAGVQGIVTRVIAGGLLVEVTLGDRCPLGTVIVLPEVLEPLTAPGDPEPEGLPCAPAAPAYLAPPLPDTTWHVPPIQARQRLR